jgi:hypothetical protein
VRPFGCFLCCCTLLLGCEAPGNPGNLFGAHGPSPAFYNGTLSRAVVPLDAGVDCALAAPPYSQGTFDVGMTADFSATNDVDFRLGPDGGWCVISADGESVTGVPEGCAEQPSGFSFTSGSFDYDPGGTASSLTLSWAKNAGACSVTDVWSFAGDL